MTDRGIALIAHDSCKPDMVDWATFNRATLARHRLYATGTTGGLLIEHVGLDVTRFRSGPLGGDQQIGSRIAEGEVGVAPSWPTSRSRATVRPPTSSSPRRC
ncbi:MAG TPA: methylglyoxal synthase [Micromonosporaceae bacterium]|jgi:methylglyoxal synthase